MGGTFDLNRNTTNTNVQHWVAFISDRLQFNSHFQSLSLQTAFPGYDSLMGLAELRGRLKILMASVSRIGPELIQGASVESVKVQPMQNVQHLERDTYLKVKFNSKQARNF